MPDRLSGAERRALMSRIRSRDTQPELLVRRLVHGLGYRYRLHQATLPGKPDMVFASRRKVILIHGCFWHGHRCGRGFRPVRNASFWSAKIDGNRARDRRTARALRRMGWRVLTVWECQLHAARQPALQARLLNFLES